MGQGRAILGGRVGTEAPRQTARPIPFPEGFPVVFGKFVLLRPMARGGMGELFLAAAGEVGGFEKLCIVKKVLAELEDDAIHRRFMDEAKVVVRLNHANLVQVFDAGRVGQEYYLAMELVEGKDLRAVWNRCAKLHRRIPVDVAIFTVREILRGLSYAHDALGIELVHRDISPPNILLSYYGDVKLTDFGLAKSALKRETTNPGVVFGRYSYLSPEQAKGLPADRRTDIYAAGIVLWELLTGRQLFPSHTLGHREALAAVRDPKVRPPSDVVPGVPDGVDEILMKALAREREGRYPDAGAFRAALSEVLARDFPTCDRDRVAEFMREIFVLERKQERREYEAMTHQDFSEVRAAGGEDEVISVSDTITIDPDEDSDVVLIDEPGEDTAVIEHDETEGGLRAAARALEGKVLDQKYRIERLIGLGGMGAVYRAEHVGIGRTCAVKVLHRRYTRDPDIVARFEREARAATATGHPNIVDVWDIGTTPAGETYFVMELLEGENFGVLLRREGALPIERVVHIVSQVCRAVSAAHDAGIIHRDLKADNVFLVARGKDPDFVKVLDFGICKSLDEGAQTAPGLVMGSPDYMAPEQAAGRPATVASDVYAVGCILFEALAGRMPYEGRNPIEVLMRKSSEDAPSVRDLRPEVPEPIAQVVAACLRRNPTERPATLRVVEYELTRAFAGRPAAVRKLLGLPESRDSGRFARAQAAPSEPPPPPVEPVPEPPPAEHPVGRAGRALLFVGLGVALGAAVFVARDPAILDAWLDRSDPVDASAVASPAPERAVQVPPLAAPTSKATAPAAGVEPMPPVPAPAAETPQVPGSAAEGEDPPAAASETDELVAKARLALEQGRYRDPAGEGLAVILAELSARKPDLPDIAELRTEASRSLWRVARRSLRRKRYEEALEPLRDLVAVAPGHEEGRASLAEVLRRLARRAFARRDYDRAETLAGEWANLDPESAPAHELVGDAASRAKRYEQAAAAYERALTLRPRDRGVRSKLRRARIRARRAASDTKQAP